MWIMSQPITDSSSLISYQRAEAVTATRLNWSLIRNRSQKSKWTIMIREEAPTTWSVRSSTITRPIIQAGRNREAAWRTTRVTRDTTKTEPRIAWTSKRRSDLRRCPRYSPTLTRNATCTSKATNSKPVRTILRGWRASILWAAWSSSLRDHRRCINSSRTRLRRDRQRKLTRGGKFCRCSKRVSPNKEASWGSVKMTPWIMKLVHKWSTWLRDQNHKLHSLKRSTRHASRRSSIFTGIGTIHHFWGQQASKSLAPTKVAKDLLPSSRRSC